MTGIPDLTAMLSVPGEATARAAAPMRSVTDGVVFELTTRIRIAGSPCCTAHLPG